MSNRNYHYEFSNIETKIAKLNTSVNLLTEKIDLILLVLKNLGLQQERIENYCQSWQEDEEDCDEEDCDEKEEDCEEDEEDCDEEDCDEEDCDEEEHDDEEDCEQEEQQQEDCDDTCPEDCDGTHK